MMPVCFPAGKHDLAVVAGVCTSFLSRFFRKNVRIRRTVNRKVRVTHVVLWHGEEGVGSEKGVDCELFLSSRWSLYISDSASIFFRMCELCYNGFLFLPFKDPNQVKSIAERES